MTNEDTGAMWVTPGRPWADLRLTRLIAGHLMSQGLRLEVQLDLTDHAYVVFDERAGLYCALNDEGLARVEWTSEDDPWWIRFYDLDQNDKEIPGFYFEDRTLSTAAGRTIIISGPRPPRTGLKPTAEMRREDAESKQPVEAVSGDQARLRSASAQRSLEHRLLQKPSEAKRRSAKQTRQRERERINTEEV